MLALQIFKVILKDEDQNNDFDMPDEKPRLIQFNRIVKAFRLQPNLEISFPFKRLHTFWDRSWIVNRFRKLVMISQIWFFIEPF